MNFHLGIDFGTSGARAIGIDAQAEVCVQASHRFTESNPQKWATEWKEVLFGLIHALPLEFRNRLRSLAINGTSSTVLLCDRSGIPLNMPLLYNDARGAGELPTLQAFLDQPPYLSAPCRGNVLNATSSLVKLLWWRQQSFFPKAHYLMHQADWLGFLLHGKAGVSDYHNCLKLGYDVAQLRYPQWLNELSEDLGIASLLPEVLPPGTPIGPVIPAIADELGLRSPCIVCAGTTDSIAAFLASGAAPGEAVTSLGSTLVLKLLSQTPVENGEFGIYSHRLGDLWLVGGASNTGGAVLLQFFTPAELEQLSAQIPADQESPLDYYPLPKPGERFPINNANLPPRLEPRPQDSLAFLHGLLESMTRIEAQGYALLQQLGATPLSRVYTAGGGATNTAWTRIRQRHLKVPVIPSQQTEAAYGTALLARGSVN